MAGYRNTPSGLRDTAGYSILQNQLLHYSLAVTPILSNVYLHYALDLWFSHRVKKQCRGEAHYSPGAAIAICHLEQHLRLSSRIRHRLPPQF